MNKLIVSFSPHVKTTKDTPRVMLDVIISLLPTFIAGAVIYGFRALLVVLTCVLTTVVSEYVFNIAVKKEQTVFDLSAIVTGLILGLSLHADTPVWQCIIGSAFAIVVVKCLFGGLGANFANPAVTGRVFLLVCFSTTIAGGAIPFFSSNPDLVAGATPLEVMRGGGDLPSLMDMFLGFKGGAIGEASILAILIGFIYLVARRVIYFETPVVMVGSVFLLSLVVDGDLTTALYHVLAGGLVYAAVFMVTDYVTTPITRSGKMIFALGCGILTYLVRKYGQYYEGVSFAILFFNILAPYIEGWTKPRAFGRRRKLMPLGRTVMDFIVCEVCAVSVALIIDCAAFFTYFASPVVPVLLILLLAAIPVLAFLVRKHYIERVLYEGKAGND